MKSNKKLMVENQRLRLLLKDKLNQDLSEKPYSKITTKIIKEETITTIDKDLKEIFNVQDLETLFLLASLRNQSDYTISIAKRIKEMDKKFFLDLVDQYRFSYEELSELDRFLLLEAKNKTTTKVFQKLIDKYNDNHKNSYKKNLIIFNLGFGTMLLSNPRFFLPGIILLNLVTFFMYKLKSLFLFKQFLSKNNLPQEYFEIKSFKLELKKQKFLNK